MLSATTIAAAVPYAAERAVFLSYFHMNKTSIKTLPFRNFSLVFCQYLRKEIHYDPIPINLSSIKAASFDAWEAIAKGRKHIVLFSRKNPYFSPQALFICFNFDFV